MVEFGSVRHVPRLALPLALAIAPVLYRPHVSPPLITSWGQQKHNRLRLKKLLDGLFAIGSLARK
jgi:hypothetical protein